MDNPNENFLQILEAFNKSSLPVYLPPCAFDFLTGDERFDVSLLMRPIAKFFYRTDAGLLAVVEEPVPVLLASVMLGCDINSKHEFHIAKCFELKLIPDDLYPKLYEAALCNVDHSAVRATMRAWVLSTFKHKSDERLLAMAIFERTVRLDCSPDFNRRKHRGKTIRQTGDGWVFTVDGNDRCQVFDDCWPGAPFTPLDVELAANWRNTLNIVTVTKLAPPAFFDGNRPQPTDFYWRAAGRLRSEANDRLAFQFDIGRPGAFRVDSVPPLTPGSFLSLLEGFDEDSLRDGTVDALARLLVARRYRLSAKEVLTAALVSSDLCADFVAICERITGRKPYFAYKRKSKMEKDPRFRFKYEWAARLLLEYLRYNPALLHAGLSPTFEALLNRSPGPLWNSFGPLIFAQRRRAAQCLVRAGLDSLYRPGGQGYLRARDHFYELAAPPAKRPCTG